MDHLVYFQIVLILRTITCFRNTQDCVFVPQWTILSRYKESRKLVRCGPERNETCLSTQLLVASEEGLQFSRTLGYLSDFQKKMDKPDSPAFVSVLFQSSFTGQRVIHSNTEWENYGQKQMHLIFQEGLDSASTCALKPSSLTSHAFQNSQADLFCLYVLT